MVLETKRRSRRNLLGGSGRRCRREENQTKRGERRRACRRSRVSPVYDSATPSPLVVRSRLSWKSRGRRLSGKRVDEAEDFNELRKGAQAPQQRAAHQWFNDNPPQSERQNPPQSTTFPPQPSEIVEPDCGRPMSAALPASCWPRSPPVLLSLLRSHTLIWPVTASLTREQRLETWAVVGVIQSCTVIPPNHAAAPL